MSNLPEEARRQLRSYISEATDKSLDLFANLLGRRIDEKDRIRLKREAEAEVGPKIEEAVTKGFQIAVKLKEEAQLNKLETASVKEKFYLVTDNIFETVLPEIPREEHAMDYLFETCKELLDLRFTFSFLKNTRYSEYLQSLESLIEKLKEEGKIDKAWDLIYEFKDTSDAYTLLQATFQKIIDYYKFLSQDFPTIEKKHLDKYLEIYSEMSGQYEKIIALIAALVKILRTDASYMYENARKKKIEKHGMRGLISGFYRNIRNALAHKTYKLDIIKETVDFYDIDRTITLTFEEIQKETRELATLLLILPHLLIFIFCSAVLSMKETLDGL